MNILIVSESFVMREYMQIFFKCLVEDANLNIKRKLNETTKQEQNKVTITAVPERKKTIRKRNIDISQL